MPAAWAAAASAVAGLAGAAISSSAAKSAASKQAASANAANQTIKDQYAQTRADLAPYRDSGSTALGQYQGLLGLNGKDAQSAALSKYTESPFLSQLVDRSTKAVEASRAARGGLFSGAAAQEIGDRAGQLYLGDYNNYLSRIGGLVDTGAGAATQTGQFGANAASGQANSLLAAGNAQAGGSINVANSINNGLSQAAQAYGAYKGGAFNSPGTNYFLNGGSASGAAKSALGIYPG